MNIKRKVLLNQSSVNLDLKKPFCIPKILGIYFSEYPAVSLAFGQILICRVMPGAVEMKDAHGEPLEDSEIGVGFNSRLVEGQNWGETGNFSVIHIIRDVSQVLPYCVIYLGQSPKPIGNLSSWNESYNKFFKQTSNFQIM